MDTLIKFPLKMDRQNECILDGNGLVFLRYTWNITPLDFLRKQEAKAEEIVSKLNALHDQFPQAVVANDPAPAPEPAPSLNGTAPKRRGNLAWVKGMVSARWGKKGA